jgi:2-iminobutanoate/2-iminopropanoate deaminase
MSHCMRTTLFTAALLVPAPLLAQRQSIVPQGQSATATLTPGIKFGDVIYASGQLGTARNDPDTTIQAQTRRSLAKIKAVMEAGGGNMASVLKCTVFLADIKDFAGMNSAYSEAFPKEPPARSTVVVAALVSPGAKVEIECIGAVAR